MNEERTYLERLVAAGAAADGLTPSYAVIRNALSDGTAINVHSAVWHVIKPQLISRRRRLLVRAPVVRWRRQLICVCLATEDADAERHPARLRPRQRAAAAVRPPTSGWR